MLKEVDNLLYLITGQLQPEYLVLALEIERVFTKLNVCTLNYPYIMHKKIHFLLTLLHSWMKLCKNLTM